MTPHDLLAAFETLAEATDGIARLRELVLQLAVRGKLVPQDPNDEPASVLLERIAAEKMRLVKEGKIPKPKPLPSVSEDEVAFGVPEGWVWCRLGDLIDLVSGQHLGPSEYHSERTGLPYLTGPADFGPVYPAATRWTNERRAVALGGDILLTVKGAGIGKTNVLDAPEAAISRQLMAIRPLLGIGSYLNLVIANAASHFREKQQGIAIPGIGREDVLYYCLAVPPLPEQHRIVAKVDALMTLLDCLEAARCERETARAALRDSALAALRDAPDTETVEAAWTLIAEHMDDLFADPADVVPLRQTVLKLAVRGKLVPQDPNDEPAYVLLERIVAEKAQIVNKGKITKINPLLRLDEDEVPFVVPEGWVWTRMGEVCDIVSGITKGRKLDARETTLLPYLRVANVQANHLDLSVIKEIELPLDEFEQYRLIPGDVLLTEGGDWDKLGRSAIWNGQIENCVYQNHIFRARSLDSGLMPRWVSMFTNSPDGRIYFQSCSKQTTNLASINKAQLRSCPLPLPSAAEQRRIVAKVDALMTLCDALEACLATDREAQAAFAAAAVHHLDV